MLAKTFRTANELGILEHELEAMQTVLFMIEDGRIKPTQIEMTSWTRINECGTTHCIAGWAHEVDKKAFPELKFCTRDPIGMKIRARVPRELAKLFAIDDQNMSMLTETAEGATKALRNYLETGRVDG